MTDAINVSPLPANGTESPALTSLILKGTSTSTTDRDAGFCSGGDEDDLEVEDDIHSPTDASEDSVEVKVTPISLRNKNKRKCAEPRKVPNDETPSGPLKKRIRFDMKQDLPESGGQSPFRPWSIPTRPVPVHPQEVHIPISVINTPSPPPPAYHPVYGFHPAVHQDEPLSLVKTRDESPRLRRERRHDVPHPNECEMPNQVPDSLLRTKDFAKVPIKIEPHPPRVPPHPAVCSPTAAESEELVRVPKASPGFSVESLLSAKSLPKDKSGPSQQKEQRNYKNMTRERRIEANARERTRVHTISAAFDTLRRSIPAYSHNQKLSKLSVLRIACSYILTLSRVAGKDYSADQSSPSLASCVDLVSRTIQTEGKLRKKKDE